MVVFGSDAHKHSTRSSRSTKPDASSTLGTTTADHLTLLTWAEQFGTERRWAVEDCRHLSRRLERDLLYSTIRHPLATRSTRAGS
jgi:transposase